MKTLLSFTKRNIKLFFRDKGMFFTSLITPVILLVLYATFLSNVYVDSLQMALPEGFTLDQKLLDGFAGAQLISSILAVSCVTVSFCSNMLMVQDKANGTIKDLTVSPVKPHVMSLGYYAATFVSTLIVCLSATAICLIYALIVGWYMSVLDVLLIVIDVILLCLFGVALSSVVNFFLSSQGQISAVGTMVSSTYGFISGAYMPISQFPEALQKVIACLPGTYGTVLVRNHAMRGIIAEMKEDGLPEEFILEVKDNFDCNLYFFEEKVSTPMLYIVIGGTVVLLIALYVLMNILRSKKANKR
ncbi:MAG: ABC transporter permease [Clostridia bacterium]|nr:ABC transporter permease [Clostridia bacterium]